MRKLSAGESYFICDGGVYALWILEHGKQLPKDEQCVLELKEAYKAYYNAVYNSSTSRHVELGRLFAAVELVVLTLHWSPVYRSYERALEEYLKGSDNELIS